MCLYPKLIKNRKYVSNKKNGGVIPLMTDDRVKYVPVGCQNCIECRKKKAREWQVRLLEDIKKHTNGKFITLTFSDESIYKLIEKEPTKTTPSLKGLEGYNLDNAIAKRAVRLFLERWRKEFKTSLRHWFVTELGHHGTKNIHLHGIVWTNESYDKIENKWEYGYVWPRKNLNNKGKWIRQHTYVNNRTINYITKYVHKQDQQNRTYKSRVLASPGIGSNYTMEWDSKKNVFNGSKTIETYRTSTGHKISMPIYWRNKIYTEKQRESLWLHRLDKQERWVCGNKIDLTKKDADKTYYGLLKHYRQVNKELGYGDDEINWNKVEYERERRNLMIKQRIERVEQKARAA